MGEYGQTACPLCRRPLFVALDWSILAAMKTLVAFIDIHTALCLLNAQYEFRQGDHWHTGMWMLALCFTACLFWYTVVGLVIPNEEDWWRIAPGGLSLATIWVTLAWSVFAIALKMWLDEGRLR